MNAYDERLRQAKFDVEVGADGLWRIAGSKEDIKALSAVATSALAAAGDALVGSLEQMLAARWTLNDEPLPEDVAGVLRAVASRLAAPSKDPANPSGDQRQEGECFCDRTNLGVRGVSCGDCPKDYASPPPEAAAAAGDLSSLVPEADMYTFAAHVCPAESHAVWNTCRYIMQERIAALAAPTGPQPAGGGVDWRWHYRFVTMMRAMDNGLLRPDAERFADHDVQSLERAAIKGACHAG